MAGGRRLPPSIERLWLGELRRAHAIINIINMINNRQRASGTGAMALTPALTLTLTLNLTLTLTITYQAGNATQLMGV
jgi:hypothetical protein